MTIKHWKFLLPLSVFHIFLLFFRIDRQSLWLDEVAGLEAVRGSWSHLWDFFRQVPEQLPLYYLLLRGWLGFGTSELVLRSLSALFALASLWAIFFLARELFDELTAKVAAVLLCLSPFYLYYGQEARMYSLVGFLTILNSLLFLKWVRSGDRKFLVAYGITALLGAYTHFFFLFVLAAHLGFLLQRERSLTPAVIRLVVVHGIVGLAYLPWVVLIIQAGPRVLMWKGAEHVIFGIPYMLLRFSVGYSELAANYEWKQRVGQLVRENAIVLTMAVVCFGTLALVGLRTIVRRGGAGLLVIWGFALPPLLALLGSAVVILVGERYLLVSFPFYLLFLAVGLVTLLGSGGSRRWVGVALVVVYLFVVGHALRAYYFDPTFGKEQWRMVAALLRASSAPNDAIVVHRGFAMDPFRYYYEPGPRQQVFRSDLVKPGDLRSAPRVWLVLRDPDLNKDYLAEMQREYHIESSQLFPKHSGISVLLMMRNQ